MNSAETLTTYSKDVLSLVTELSTVSFVALGIVVALMIMGLRLGKEHLVAVNLALFVAYLFYLNFPYTDRLPTDGGWLTGAAIFIGFTAALYLLLRRVIATSFDDGGALLWLQTGLLALSATFLGAAFLYALFPVPHTPILTPILTEWLTTSAFLFWWMLVPIVVILFTTRR